MAVSAESESGGDGALVTRRSVLRGGGGRRQLQCRTETVAVSSKVRLLL